MLLNCFETNCCQIFREATLLLKGFQLIRNLLIKHTNKASTEN